MMGYTQARGVIGEQTEITTPEKRNQEGGVLRKNYEEPEDTVNPKAGKQLFKEDQGIASGLSKEM